MGDSGTILSLRVDSDLVQVLLNALPLQIESYQEGWAGNTTIHLLEDLLLSVWNLTLNILSLDEAIFQGENLLVALGDSRVVEFALVLGMEALLCHGLLDEAIEHHFPGEVGLAFQQLLDLLGVSRASTVSEVVNSCLETCKLLLSLVALKLCLINSSTYSSIA